MSELEAQLDKHSQVTEQREAVAQQAARHLNLQNTKLQQQLSVHTDQSAQDEKDAQLYAKGWQPPRSTWVRDACAVYCSAAAGTGKGVSIGKSERTGVRSFTKVIRY